MLKNDDRLKPFLESFALPSYVESVILEVYCVTEPFGLSWRKPRSIPYLSTNN